ncbi:MAG: hypothetical protein ACFE9L_09090 [Candidatus Hodarchaeota archaeon]
MRQNIDYKRFNFLELSILGFGIITLPEIIVMLFKIVIYLFPDTLIELGFLSSEDLESLSEALSALQYKVIIIITAVHRKLLTSNPLEKNEEITIGIDPNQAYAYGIN